VGIGCAAHSFFPPVRTANIRDVNRYALEVTEGRIPREFTETLDAKKLGMEMIFLGLRTVEGINEDDLLKKTGKYFSDFTDKEKVRNLVSRRLLVHGKPFWKPTKKGLLMADAMAREIIL
jgi:oxygen-independent coproporphyrinogen-3 oxidase